MKTMSLIVILGCVLFYLGMNDFGGGVDGGIHYGMADSLARHLVWPFPRDSFLGAAAHYPPAAHLLAVALGSIVGATLHGIFIVTAMSFVLFYVFVADLLKARSDPRTLAHFMVFVILAVALRKFRFVAGNEVTENFFFAQFAGNAALMAGFYVAYRSVALSLGAWLAICAVAVHMAGWFFPLSAINLALAAAVLRIAPMTDVRRDTKRRLIEVATSAAVLCTVAIVHPTMLDMLRISNNNGGITIANATIILIVIASVVLGAVWRWVFSGSDSVRRGALFALNIGALAPCLALVVLNMLGIGSLYAAKKSGFLLGTVVLMMAAVLIVDISYRIMGPRFVMGSRLTNLHGAFKLSRFQLKLASCLFVGTVMVCVVAGRHHESIGRLKSFDRDVRELLSRSAGENLYGVTILLGSAFSAHVNYLIGFALLRQTVANEVQHGFFFTSKPELDDAKFAIVDARDGDGYEPGCVLQSSRSLALVTSQCLAARLQ